ncbi:hypothetical protein Hte_009226 [Hypoxylon texense]
MSSRINTILIIGATAGIGEAFTRRFHAMGKKVIATGRNRDKLSSLANELPGLKTRHIDILDLGALPQTVHSILHDFPTLDTVLFTAGTQLFYSFFDPSSATPESIHAEVATNLTAPALLIRLFAPHLLQLANKGTETTLFITGSSIGYAPLSFYPTYYAAKSGVRSLIRVLRHQLAATPNGDNMRVVEIVPPYTDTGLGRAHREARMAAQGGPEKAFPVVPLAEFVDRFFESLEQPGPDGKIKKEISVGSGEAGVST